MLKGIDALRQADRDGDIDALGELLAPNVIFRSPFASSVRFEGKEEVLALHRDVFDILDDRDAAEPLVSETAGCFNFSATINGTPIDAVVYAFFDESGAIVELKVLARPLPGLAALFVALPPRVARRRGGPVRGLITAIGGRMFLVLARAFEFLAPILLPVKGALPAR